MSVAVETPGSPVPAMPSPPGPEGAGNHTGNKAGNHTGSPAGNSVPRTPDIPAARTSEQAELPLPALPPASAGAVALLAQARRGILDAGREEEPSERFIAAYLSALRAAAAVLAARGRPHRGRARPASVWVLLETSAPELKEWAAYFNSHSATQAAAQAGITRRVTGALADELLRQGGRFVELAGRAVHGSA
jgi:hypothetical protein